MGFPTDDYQLNRTIEILLKSDGMTKLHEVVLALREERALKKGQWIDINLPGITVRLTSTE